MGNKLSDQCSTGKEDNDETYDPVRVCGCAMPELEDVKNLHCSDVLAPVPVFSQTFAPPSKYDDPYHIGLDPESSEKRLPGGGSDWRVIPGNDELDRESTQDSEKHSHTSKQSGRETTPDHKDHKDHNVSSHSPRHEYIESNARAHHHAPIQEVMEEPQPTPQPQAPTPDQLRAAELEELAKKKKAKKEIRRDVHLHDVLEETHWCLYCIYLGCGIFPDLVNKKCELDCMCCSHVCESEPCCFSGCCECVHHCGCCNCIGSFPPQQGTPCCLWCGDPCATCCGVHRKYICGKSKAPEVEAEAKPSPYISMLNQHDMTFCCCCGCGYWCVAGCEILEDMCCYRCHFRLSHCTFEPPCCNALWTCGRCTCQCGPVDMLLNPVCACCGWRWRKRFNDNSGPIKFEGPSDHHASKNSAETDKRT